MSDKNKELNRVEPLRTLSDEQLITERKLPRRSFLGASGALIAGVSGIASGMYAAVRQDDPNKRPNNDPPKPEDRPKPDDQPKPEDRPKSEEERKAEERRRKAEERRKAQDRPKPDDTPKPDDPHR
jgi:outer membrane biosynthesis protein TonB